VWKWILAHICYALGSTPWNRVWHISCAYAQFEHLLARAFIVAHLAKHHSEHFLHSGWYTPEAHAFSLFHTLCCISFFLRGGSLVKGSFSFYLCLCLMSLLVNKEERFWDFTFPLSRGRILSFGLPLIQEGEICYLELLLVVLSCLPPSRGTSFDFSFCVDLMLWIGFLCSDKAFCAPMRFWLLASGVEPFFASYWGLAFFFAWLCWAAAHFFGDQVFWLL
jgi:hypothetical protein